MKKVLTDRTLKALRAKARRYDVWDAIVPGLAVHVTTTGARSFVLVARYAGARNPTRRLLGSVGAITLADAREKARHWLGLIHRGRDPKHEEERKRLAEQRKQANTFAAVAEDFIVEKLPGERKGKEVEKDIRREFIPAWGHMPVSEITELDILPIINAKKRHAPAQARNLLGTARRLFAWAKDQRIYGLVANPCADLRPAKLIGDKHSGDRILTDDELFALWRAAKRMPYPYGAAYQLLVLTALRLNEVCDASWRPEFDLHNRVWEIPASRMKGKNGKARPHVVPITDEIAAILKALPRFKTGEYLFSTTFGASPVWIGSKIKRQLDKRMLRTLRALARQRGDDPAKVTLPPFINHDIRRTVRSSLSRLKIAEEVREAVLGHVRPGIKGTYDKHDYFDEKKEALEQWAARLRSIVEPPPDNVVQMPARA